MATEEEKNNQQDLNESKKEEISLEQELIRILAQRQGISSETLTDQQDVSNVLKDQIKQFDFQNTPFPKINICNNVSCYTNNLRCIFFYIRRSRSYP